MRHLASPHVDGENRDELALGITRPLPGGRSRLDR